MTSLSSCCHYVLAINTLGAGPVIGVMIGTIGRTLMGFTLVTGRTDGMQAWTIINCRTL